jgi:hypothetical protein
LSFICYRLGKKTNSGFRPLTSTSWVSIVPDIASYPACKQLYFSRSTEDFWEVCESNVRVMVMMDNNMRSPGVKSCRCPRKLSNTPKEETLTTWRNTHSAVSLLHQRPSMSSQPYVQQNAPAALYLTNSQIALLENLPVIKSPHDCPVPPSPLRHFLPALGHRP